MTPQPLHKVTTKTPEEIEILREGGKKLAKILQALKDEVRPGVSSFELENLARSLTEEEGGVPSFLGYTPAIAKRPYPAALCLSINDVVVHGIPNEQEYILEEGDIVTLDMGIGYQGLYVDSAITVGVGNIDNRATQLIKAGEDCLNAAVEALKHWPEEYPKGIKTGDIGFVVESALDYYTEKYGFNIVEIFGGHGVGYSVHEDPFIPNYGRGGTGTILKPNMVIAIEPIISERSGDVILQPDGYTYKTRDGGRATHAEHTILITENGAEVLTEI